MKQLNIVRRALAASALMLMGGCATRQEARKILSSQFQPQTSAIGRLSILSPAPLAFHQISSAPEEKFEVASNQDYTVVVRVDPNQSVQWLGQAPTRTQAADMFEGLGKDAHVELRSISLDGHPGVLATTTALGHPKPVWMAMYFGAGGLVVQAQGNDTREVTRRVCEDVVRSIRFQP